MRVVFVENDDSFSWNVIDGLPVERSAIDIVWGADSGDLPARLAGSDALILGSGPTDPQRAGLLRWVRAAIALRIPTLGICLGHQAIGQAFGARVVATAPCHGRRSTVLFGSSRLFPAFRGPVEVMRYHSLVLVDVPPPLSVIAATAEGEIMAIEHASLPIAGVQFHPDSFGTPRGREMLEAFLRAAS